LSLNIITYIKIYDSEQRDELPKRIKHLFSTLEQSPSYFNIERGPISSRSIVINNTSDELKRKLIKRIKALPIPHDGLLETMFFILNNKNNADLVFLISKINQMISKHSPSKMIESEVHTFLDYLIYKHDVGTKI
jgi:hypothetical protein